MKSYYVLKKQVFKAIRVLKIEIEDCSSDNEDYYYFDDDELAEKKQFKFKTQKCSHFYNEGCLRPNFCHFAHGDADIKTDV